MALTMYELEPGTFYHVVDENRRTVAAVYAMPFDGVWVAREPGLSQRILARDERKLDLLPKLQAMRDKGEM